MLSLKPAGKLSTTRATTHRHDERGAALAMTMIIMGLIAVISISVMAVVTNEVKVAGSDLERTQTFYAAHAGLEKMTNDFSNLFLKTHRPTQTQLDIIAAAPPTGLTGAPEYFSFSQTITPDAVTLADMKATHGGRNPVVTITNGNYAGMFASISPYKLTSVATHVPTNTQVRLERDINNYLIPLFQFGTFSDNDLEFWPEPPMNFNGRVHSNGNIYFGGDITFLDKVTTAGEAVRDKLRNGAANNTTVGGLFASNPRIKDVNGVTTLMTKGSVVNGPYLTPQPRTDLRGNYPTSPAGTDNTTWNPSSTAPVVSGTPDKFGGQLLTASTGAKKLLLPLQFDGRKPYELIKRAMPDDNSTMADSRYHTKSEIRILIDDENAGSGSTNVAGIPAGQGVSLAAFTPSELDGGKALRVIDDSGNYLTTTDWFQGDSARNKKALTVRGVRNNYATPCPTPRPAVPSLCTAASNSDSATGGKNANAADVTYNSSNSSVPKNSSGGLVSPGSGIKGRILIEIVPAATTANPSPTPIDVTQAILSMGVTVGEPNSIVNLQRPLWAAFMQGSRDRNGGNTYLSYFFDNSVSNRRAIADGEINIASGLTMNAAGFINTPDTSFDDDPPTSGAPFLPVAATMDRDDLPATTGLNQIVPINVYNVREGRIYEFSASLPATSVYSRGITSVVELNMRNLARWCDGVYDTNLLNGTSAVSSNIGSPDGWIVYVSDRRGDRVKSERTHDATGALTTTTVTTTNGLVDNEDIYNYPATASATPDPGEDVLDDGWDVVKGVAKKDSLQRDTLELPDPAAVTAASVTPPSGYSDSAKYGMALTIGTWGTSSQTTAGTAGYYFRRAVRLFNGEDLKLSGAANKLSDTKGLTVATENMVYIWGNYNTTGINASPASGISTLNDSSKASYYTGDQVPAAIAADAFFPISKTWFDSLSAMYPEGGDYRIADAGNGGSPTGTNSIAVGQETSVRAGIIAGSTLSAVGPSLIYNLQWLNGGVHNFPRFLETWGASGTGWEKRWNYVGSFIILYNSTQALGPWGVYNSVIYYPPNRNWAFDMTFQDPNKLPPGTPQFEFIQATGFRQTVSP